MRGNNNNYNKDEFDGLRTLAAAIVLVVSHYVTQMLAKRCSKFTDVTVNLV